MVDWDALVNGPCLDVFGETPELRPSYVPPGGGVPVFFDAAFDDAYVAILEGAEGPEVTTIQPILGVRLAQFAAGHPRQDGQVTVPRVGKTFLISNVEPDGKGWALLRLQLKAP